MGLSFVPFFQDQTQFFTASPDEHDVTAHIQELLDPGYKDTKIF
jgi:hypothetical protein